MPTDHSQVKKEPEIRERIFIELIRERIYVTFEVSLLWKKNAFNYLKSEYHLFILTTFKILLENVGVVLIYFPGF